MPDSLRSPSRRKRSPRQHLDRARARTRAPLVYRCRSSHPPTTLPLRHRRSGRYVRGLRRLPCAGLLFGYVIGQLGGLAPLPAASGALTAVSSGALPSSARRSRRPPPECSPTARFNSEYRRCSARSRSSSCAAPCAGRPRQPCCVHRWPTRFWSRSCARSDESTTLWDVDAPSHSHDRRRVAQSAARVRGCGQSAHVPLPSH
jgi:hypothetical protein